jgi:hypothetical protein
MLRPVSDSRVPTVRLRWPHVQRPGSREQGLYAPQAAVPHFFHDSSTKRENGYLTHLVRYPFHAFKLHCYAERATVIETA